MTVDPARVNLRNQCQNCRGPAAQRIKGLNLAGAIRNAVKLDRGASIKTLVDEFTYPRLGAGQVYR